MAVTAVTVQHLAMPALIFSALALIVVFLRQRPRVPFGDGDNHGLGRARDAKQFARADSQTDGSADYCQGGAAASVGAFNGQSRL
jgi:hypothetical protein